MAKANVISNQTRRNALALTATGIVAALTVTTAKATKAAPAINPELARLMEAEAQARAAYDAYRPAFDQADRDQLAGKIGKRAFRQIERGEAERLDAMCDAQCDVIAFPAIERADVIAKAKWIAARYPNPAEFMTNEADAIWTAFVTIANVTA